ncbi:MAG: hypothetical protein KC978_09610 [Candidatus Omnitrophica bacterium]|nr:hypothetical protein [Candidatus Omnitrophota bacterium]
MAITCPECEERIPSNSKECPECGAIIDVSIRYNPVRVVMLVVALSIILFVAIPSIVKTIFFSEPPPAGDGVVVSLEEIKKEVGDEQIIKLVKANIQAGDEKEGEVEMTWGVTVKNRSSVPLLFDTDLRFLDESGQEVHSEYILESPLPGEAEKTLKGKFSLPPTEAERIKNMRAIVQPADEAAAGED